MITGIILVFLAMIALAAYFELAPTSWERKENKRFKEEKRKWLAHKEAERRLQEQLSLAAERRHYVKTLQAERTCM